MKNSFKNMLYDLFKDLKLAILSTKITNPEEILEYIDERIVEFSKEVANVFNTPLRNSWEAPIVIDLLRKNKCVSETCWYKLMGLFLIVDAFKLQENITFHTDLEFLLKYIQDLEKLCC